MAIVTFSPVQAFFFFFFLGWSGTETTITEVTTGLMYQPRMINDDECGAIGGMLGRENLSTPRKPAPVPLCLLQIPNDLTRARTRVAPMGSRRLIAWATARPPCVRLLASISEKARSQLQVLPSKLKQAAFFCGRFRCSFRKTITNIEQTPFEFRPHLITGEQVDYFGLLSWFGNCARCLKMVRKSSLVYWRVLVYFYFWANKE
jgi:hypothetical protein